MTAPRFQRACIWLGDRLEITKASELINRVCIWAEGGVGAHGAERGGVFLQQLALVWPPHPRQIESLAALLEGALQLAHGHLFDLCAGVLWVLWMRRWRTIGRR
jgi:hypothetical protein